MPTTWKDVVSAVRATKPAGTSLKDVLREASVEWSRIKKGKHPTKTMASLTMPGKKDFTTKKTSKVFHRKGHYEETAADGTRRRPYRGIRKPKGKGRGKGKAVSKLPMSESVLIVEESPMAGGQAPADVQAETNQADDQNADANLDLIQESNANDAGTVIQKPGMGDNSENDEQSGGRKRRHRKTARRSARRHRRKTARRHRRRTARRS
jgi:hypothetical protein